jgi:alpha-beta hydrolase superfamily lysophospholipase
MKVALAALGQDPESYEAPIMQLVNIVEGGERARGRAAAWTMPTLPVYAGADRCVAPAGSAAFAAAAPRAWLTHTCYPQMAHEIFNEPEREQPLAQLTRWLGTLSFAAAEHGTRS